MQPATLVKSKLLRKQKDVLGSKLTAALSHVGTRETIAINTFGPAMVTALVNEMNLFVAP